MGRGSSDHTPSEAQILAELNRQGLGADPNRNGPGTNVVRKLHQHAVNRPPRHQEVASEEPWNKVLCLGASPDEVQDIIITYFGGKTRPSNWVLACIEAMQVFYNRRLDEAGDQVRKERRLARKSDEERREMSDKLRKVMAELEQRTSREASLRSNGKILSDEESEQMDFQRTSYLHHHHRRLYMKIQNDRDGYADESHQWNREKDDLSLQLAKASATIQKGEAREQELTNRMMLEQQNALRLSQTMQEFEGEREDMRRRMAHAETDADEYKGRWGKCSKEYKDYRDDAENKLRSQDAQIRDLKEHLSATAIPSTTKTKVGPVAIRVGGGFQPLKEYLSELTGKQVPDTFWVDPMDKGQGQEMPIPSEFLPKGGWGGRKGPGSSREERSSSAHHSHRPGTKKTLVGAGQGKRW